MDIPADRTHAAAAGAATAPADATARRLVWDAPVRVFHWLMVACFAIAWLTAESERWRLVHVTLGYTMAGLLAFRLVWGVIGTRHARFSAFVRGPAAAWSYLRSLAGPRPEHHVGHNPAGALAIVGLLVLTAVVTGSGWLNYEELGGEWLEDLHEGAAEVMLVLVGVHLAGVVVGSLVHRENLVGAMITGRKRATAGQAIRRSRVAVAALLLAAVLGFWVWQGLDSNAASGAAGIDGAVTSQPQEAHGARAGRPRHDDD